MIIPVLTCHCSTSFFNKIRKKLIQYIVGSWLTSGFYVSLWPSLPQSPCESKPERSESIKLFQVLLVMCKCRRNWISLHSHHQRQTNRQHVRIRPVNCLVYIHNCGTTSETTPDSLLLWLKEEIIHGPNNKQNQNEQLLIASLPIYKTIHKYCYIQCVLALQVFNSSALGPFMTHSGTYLLYLHMYEYYNVYCISAVGNQRNCLGDSHDAQW